MLGKVDLLGLNEFGQNPGLNPIWGTLIGGGVSGLTSITLGHTQTGKLAENRELIGLMAGLGTAGVMYAMKSTRHAALGAAVGALLASGLAWMEKVMLGTVQLPATTAAVATQVAAQAAAGGAPPPGTAGAFGIANIRQLGISNLRQLGLSTVANVPHARGVAPGAGVAGVQLGNARPPINLMGPGSPASRQVALMGGPPIHGIGHAYGATVVGGGR